MRNDAKNIRTTQMHASNISPQSLHFLTHASKDAADWPFYQSMRNASTKVSVFGNSVSLKYPRRLWLYLVGWPKLFLSGFALAGQSLSALEPATIVTVHDHMILLAFKIRRFWSLKARRTPYHLVLHGFIFTPRSSWALNVFRKIYFGTLFRGVDLIICHSHHEVPSIRTLVNMTKTSVEAVHYGIGEGDIIREWWGEFQGGKIQTTVGNPIRILSAGRSSRDYTTLANAMTQLGSGFTCDIICDNYEVAPKAIESDKVAVHRNVYGHEYTQKILEADIVMVPIAADDISAGQMVLLHALAAARPVILTKTPTSSEYIEDTAFTRLVPPVNPEAIAAAIKDISKLLPLSTEKRKTIRRLFDEKFSDVAHGRAVYSLFSSIYSLK